MRRQRKACRSPRLNLVEPQSGSYVAPVLMSDSITPRVQHFQGGLTSRIAAVERGHRRPKGKAEAAEIRAEVPRVRVARVQLAALDEQVPNDRPMHRRRDRADEHGDGLRMEVAAEALKLRREQGYVGVVHLERGVPAPTPETTDGTVSLLNFIERVLRVAVPTVECAGRHGANVQRKPVLEMIVRALGPSARSASWVRTGYTGNSLDRGPG